MEILLIDEQLSPLFGECLPSSLQQRVAEANVLALGAVDSSSRLPMGAMLASVSGESIYIDWLYTLSEYRGAGVASSLLGRLSLMLVGRDEIRQIVAAFPQTHENEALADFFQSLGFCVTVTEGRTYYFTPVQLKKAEFWKTPVDSSSILSLKNTPDYLLRELSAELRKKGLSAVALPIKCEDYDPDFSAVCTGKSGICALLLLKKAAFGYELSFVYSNNSGRDLRRLLNYVGRLAIDKLPQDTQIAIAAINSSAEALLKGLLPELEPLKEVYAAVSVIRDERSIL